MANTGTISASELAKKLVNSKKIMNKVDSGDYEKGNINEDILRKAPEEISESSTNKKSLGLPVGIPSVEKIRGSRLPDTIKQAMIDKPIPIPEISLNEELSLELVTKAKKLMEEDNGSNKRGTTTKQSHQINENLNPSVPNNLELIIENVLRRVLDEKLTQILNAQGGTNLNENLAIKVGDSIFTGKITKVKNTK